MPISFSNALLFFFLSFWVFTARAGNDCQFNCATDCLVVVADQVDSTSQYVTISVSGCKGGPISWFSCRDSGCQVLQCSGSLAEAQRKCDASSTGTFLISKDATTMTLQYHDGALAGNTDCSTTSCDGGSGGGCTVSGSSVLHVCTTTITLPTDKETIPDLDLEDDPTGGTGGVPQCQTDLDCVPVGGCSVGTCNPSKQCVFTPKALGTVCRESVGVCDEPETCDGVSSLCPLDSFKSSAVVCRAALSNCDIAESCSGSSPDCPEDQFVAAGTVCRESAGVCDVEERCDGTPLCPEDSKEPLGTVCRSAATLEDGTSCDEEEVCDGASNDCPPDVYQPANTLCRAVAGVCDVEERCLGTSPNCPSDSFQPATLVCREKVVAADGTSCDVEEKCTGSSAFCPPNDVLPVGTECRAVAGICDVAETCDGSDACPTNGFVAAGTVCRAKVVAADGTTCDQDEVCSGDSALCPADEFLPTGTVCRANADLCDVPETCNGGRDCPTDIRKDHGYVYKCSTTCYVCAVAPNELVLGNGQAYNLGGCGIGKCANIVALPWPSCVNQCISSMCPNNRGLSNSEIYTCNKTDGAWGCDYKLEGEAVAVGVCPQWN